MSPEQLAYKLEEVLEAESLLIGRVTYESFAGAWPTRSGEFADKMKPCRSTSSPRRCGTRSGTIPRSSGATSPGKIVLKLADTRTFASGVVIHTHTVPTGK